MQNHRELPAGSMVQEYRIEQVLGAGNFGIVYKASNIYLDEIVAIKEFFPADLAHRRDDTQVVPLSSATEESYRWALDHFLKEAKILWELGQPEPNPNIIQVKRFHKANGTAYMVMEYEQGKPLSKLLRECQTLPQAQIESILFPLLDGLECVHQASVLHRDIKPSNILIRADGSPVLIDFGAARANFQNPAQSTMAVYSPVYAAPEQITPAWEQGPWTDIYSLGATLYHAVIGNAPTYPLARSQTASHLPAMEAVSEGYNPVFLAAIDAAIELDPAKRPQNIAELRHLFLDTPARQGTILKAPTATPLGDKTVVASQSSQKTQSADNITPLDITQKSIWKTTFFKIGIFVLFLVGVSTIYFFPPSILTIGKTQSEVDRATVNNQIQSILGNIECSVLIPTLTEDFRLEVSGHVPDDKTRNQLIKNLRTIPAIEKVSLSLQVYERPFCEIIALLQQRKTIDDSQTGQIRLKFNRANRIYQTGDYLVVKVKTGEAFPGYLTVDYFDGVDDVVTHLLPSPPRPNNQISAGGAITLGIEKENVMFGSDRSYLLQHPGKSLIVVLYSKKPLFKALRPEEEPIKNYRVVLQNALAKVPEHSRPKFTFEIITVASTSMDNER